ncbi:C-terminal processing protease CtpA/Prc [Aquimarina sp. MAR_2010_214]|uniref:S41 family peptidase n=1 Tax=Aquimarina sp. MAR_2010_214 TaxID=1250026 RepID=UPI000C7004A6|nr:S41 family peptidase [Aquimarina sp. MAR_2010_214]PKV52797.1 C-terminal processing protease CtpA/Prc [Aquimarina sp. MAR_2010_214]
MKKSFFIVLLIIFCSCSSKSQIVNADYRFEEYEKGSHIPKNWFTWGGYSIAKDSIHYNSGNYAVNITSNDDEKPFGSIAYQLPYSLPGKKITLEGYIKTKNVKGRVGLLLRIDKDDESLEFDNMYSQNINGSGDWTKYKITLPNHMDATNIYIGGILSGNGEVWFDDFSVYIDGKRYQDVVSTMDNKDLLFKEAVTKESEANNNYIDSNFRIYGAVSENQINNLQDLAKEWGYLKYHNSLVSSGAYNWDKELLEILPLTVDNDFKSKLIHWKKSFKKGQNHDIEYNHYLEFDENVGNPIFKNEPNYPKMDWKDTGYKLLTLFRLWNMVEYFHPSKHLANNWNGVLRKYIPEFIETDDEVSYKLTVLRLIGEINDTHSTILQMGKMIDSFFGMNIAPLEIKFIQNEFVVTNILNKNLDIKKGDIITKINEKNIDRNVNILKKYAIGSNESARIRDVCFKLLRTNNKFINLTIKRDNKEINKEVFCTPIGQVNFFNKDLPSHKELDNDIGYIYPGSLKKGEINKIMKKYLSKKGLIIDLRCYPSDFIVFNLSDYLLPKPVEFVKFSKGSIENPGKFNFASPLTVGRNNSDYYKGKVVILVDEYTQSQAEYTVMALKTAPKAKVIGSQTAGADGNISKINLPGNISTMISGLGVYYPNGDETQGIGIVPDVQVNLTIEGIKSGKDEILESAKQYILNEN